jgi:hypothetical protein
MHRPSEEPLRLGESFTGFRFLARRHECTSRGEEGWRRFRESEVGGQEACLLEVVSDDLSELLRPTRQIADPVSASLMEGGALRLREPCVCRIADQTVFEGVFAVARDRGRPLSTDQVARGQGVEEGRDVVAAAEVPDGPLPEDVTDHRSA